MIQLGWPVPDPRCIISLQANTKSCKFSILSTTIYFRIVKKLVAMPVIPLSITSLKATPFKMKYLKTSHVQRYKSDNVLQTLLISVAQKKQMPLEIYVFDVPLCV